MVVTGAGANMDLDSAQASGENIWGDSETQKFYCELLELQAFLPSSMLKNVPPKPEAESEVTEEVLDSEIPAEEVEDDGSST